MHLPPTLSEFKLKLIQYRVFQIVVKDGGIFLPSEGNKEYEQEQWLQLKLLFLLGYNLKIVI